MYKKHTWENRIIYTSKKGTKGELDENVCAIGGISTGGLAASYSGSMTTRLKENERGAGVSNGDTIMERNFRSLPTGS